MNSNTNFIFGLLNKRKVAFYMSLEGILDFIYYIIPYTFTLLLTMPFTVKKATLVAIIFIGSKFLRCFLLYILRKYRDSYLYDHSKEQKLEYYNKLTQIPVEKLSKYQTGYLESIISKISDLVHSIISAEYISIIMSYGLLFYTIYNQSKMIFLISLLCSVSCVTLSVYILKKSNEMVDDLYNKEYEYDSKYQDFISNIRTIKSLNNNKYFSNIIYKDGKECYKKNKRYVKWYSMEELLRNILIIIPFALAIIKAVIDLSNGNDTLGLITCYIAVYMEIGWIFDELSNTIVKIFQLKVLRKKCIDLFSSLDDRKIINDFNEIEFKDVSLKYKESKFSIIVDNMVVNKNDKISITGKSGQGKTSVINLILGNISSYKGKVIIDNFDLKDYRLDIGVVGQEIELFNMSIKDNLCLDKDISDKEIINYLKELELDEILQFEEGIYTIVGEKGLKLSTGQKRRINILRSYLMNKIIYVLDEPTSNLDKHTEEIVVKFILKHFNNKTLIIATHNKKINKLCNKFYEFNNHELTTKKQR